MCSNCLELPSKGQSISKGIFGVFNSSKKKEPKNFNFCPRLLRQKIFLLFLEELKKPKSPFEINWPLESHSEGSSKQLSDFEVLYFLNFVSFNGKIWIL